MSLSVAGLSQALSLPAGITVLLSLTVFMLLVAEIMPATSDSVPLIGEVPGSAEGPCLTVTSAAAASAHRAQARGGEPALQSALRCRHGPFLPHSPSCLFWRFRSQRLWR